jgi:ribosome maturation factor RimP
MLWKKERKDGSEDIERLLAPVADGLDLVLVEITLARHRGSVQVNAIVFKHGGIGIDDCSRFHRAITPRLELSFPEQDIHIEVSSPGINRIIRDGTELAKYTGSPVKFYSTELSDWIGGTLEHVTDTYIKIKGTNGMETLNLENVAKAMLDSKAAL